jgi:hypothetical protein
LLPWNPIQPSHYSVISLPPFLAWTLKNHRRDLESWLALLRCSHLVAYRALYHLKQLWQKRH